MLTKDAVHVLERMDRVSTALENQASSVAQLATGLKVNAVVYSGTVLIGADGTYFVNARSNFASATIRPKGSDVVINTQGQSSSVTPQGPGVFLIEAGIERTVAVAGNVLSLTGTPGALVAVTLWERPQSPEAAETHPIMADVTAISPARIAGNLTSVTLAVANPARRGCLIFHENPSATFLWICFGPVASSTNYTVLVAGGAYFEVPGPPYYRGIITGIFSAATGAAQVTELV